MKRKGVPQRGTPVSGRDLAPLPASTDALDQSDETGEGHCGTERTGTELVHISSLKLPRPPSGRLAEYFGDTYDILNGYARSFPVALGTRRI